MIYLQLFLSFFRIGAFSFGGGYAAMPLIQSEVVSQNSWLTMSDFTDLVTISQMTPGPIAINAATFVGERVGGIWGAIAATFGCILPSCLIVTLIAGLYARYRSLDTLQGILALLRPAVVALIAGAGTSILITAFWAENAIRIDSLKIKMVFIFLLSMILLLKYKKNPVFVMLVAGGLNVLIYFLKKSGLCGIM